jgi:NhaP-type Na+/H+ or K+/H+ antiporter
MLEGESLLNDASGLTLFEVFFHLVSWRVSRCRVVSCMRSLVGWFQGAVSRIAGHGSWDAWAVLIDASGLMLFELFYAWQAGVCMFQVPL